MAFAGPPAAEDENISPPPAWSGVPEGAESFALVPLSGIAGELKAQESVSGILRSAIPKGDRELGISGNRKDT